MIFGAIFLLIVMVLSVAGTAGHASSEITTGPPPPRPITAVADKEIYILNDTIRISGQVRDPESGQSVKIAVYYPNNKIYLSREVDVSPNGTFVFEQKVEGKGISGKYLAEVSYGDFRSNVVFMVIAGPFNLVVDGDEYPILYKVTSGTLSGITIDPAEKSLTIHIANSSQSGELTIELPRNVIDAKSGDAGSDTSFVVLISNKPVGLEQAEFSEPNSNSSMRTLIIKVPYNGTDTLYDDWYIKILGTTVVPEFDSIVVTALAAISVGAALLPTARRLWCIHDN